MPYYIESSALVKLFLDEPGSDALRVWSHREYVISSELTRTEVIRAVRRLTPQLMPVAVEAVNSVTLLTCTGAVFDRAGMLNPLTLRSLDAIHLASAMSLGSELQAIVTYDNRLAEAATFHDIRVIAPL